MTRRVRFLAGSLSLAAMTFSFAETVLASVCMPMDPALTMDPMAMDEMAMAGEDGAMDCMLMAHESEVPDTQERQDHCPLAPAVGAGCSAVASLPSHTFEADALSARSARAAVSRDLDLGVLLPHALFHPPRA